MQLQELLQCCMRMCITLSTAHKYQGGRARGARLAPAVNRCHQEIPSSPYEATWCAALRALKGDESEIPELFLLWVIPISLFFPPASAGKLGLWYTDFPCLQLLIFPCCGFLGAFLNHELIDSSRLEQGSQSKCLVFPPQCGRSEFSWFACGAWTPENGWS